MYDSMTYSFGFGCLFQTFGFVKGAHPLEPVGVSVVLVSSIGWHMCMFS